MKLSAPIYLLKRRARLLAREEGISLTEALDRIARREGFSSWSLLAARASAAQSTALPASARALFTELAPGDLVLIAARPRQGKTLLGLELLIEAMEHGRRAAFLTLEYNAADVAERFAALGVDPESFDGRFECDTSDAISAGYIRDRLESAPHGTVVVVDYLQLLDQRRANPALMDQVEALRAFARERQLIIVLLSQVDRQFDAVSRQYPDLDDVRLPNPLDLGLFDKACFLNAGRMYVAATG